MSILSKDSILGYFDRLKDTGLDEESVNVMKNAYRTSIEQNSRHAEYLKNSQGQHHHLSVTAKDNLDNTYMVPSSWNLRCVVEDIVEPSPRDRLRGDRDGDENSTASIPFYSHIYSPRDEILHQD